MIARARTSSEAMIIVRRRRDDATITMREVLFARNDGRVLVTHDHRTQVGVIGGIGHENAAPKDGVRSRTSSATGSCLERRCPPRRSAFPPRRSGVHWEDSMTCAIAYVRQSLARAGETEESSLSLRSQEQLFR